MINKETALDRCLESAALLSIQQRLAMIRPLLRLHLFPGAMQRIMNLNF